MKTKTKFIQIDCVEGKQMDSRQAKAITKYHPDIIVLEYPNDGKTPDFDFNNYPANKKPIQKVLKIQEMLRKTAKTNPWAQSDIDMWENIISEWKNGNNVLVFKIDGPIKLTSDTDHRNKFTGIPHHIKWWTRIYLREQFMVKNMNYILNKYPNAKTVLVFLQSFHWDHVKLLLKDPTKNKVWKLYFSRFKNLTKESLELKLKKYPNILSYYKKYSD